MPKQSAVNAGVGLSLLAARFFFGHAMGGGAAVGTFADLALERWAAIDSFNRGLGAVGLAAWQVIRFYPRLVRESFNNKKEAVRALKACFEESG